jgi:hypothetical protein
MKSSVYKIKNLKDVFDEIDPTSGAAKQIELANIHSAPGSAINEDLIAQHQGIMAMDDEGDYIISGSAKGNYPSYFYPIIANHGRHLGKFNLSDEVPVSNTYSSTGGIQVAENILVVSSEEFVGINTKKDSSLIRFFNISDPDNAEHLTHLDIVRKGEAQNAAAVGLVTIDDQWIMAIRANKSMDFFVLNGDIMDTKNKFESIGSIGLGENNLGRFQSINLLADDAGELYFIGFCPDGESNSAELIKVETKRNGGNRIIVVVAAETLASKDFTTIDPCVKFKYGACAKYTDGRFEITSVCSHVNNTKIILNKWG